MPIWNFQSNMNKGELDPLLLGRIDLSAYYNGLATASNVLTLPQGGAKKRPGTEFLGEALGNGRIEEFSFNTEQNYLLVFTDDRMQVYKDGVLQTNLNGSGNDYITTPWGIEDIPDFDYIQSADTVIITHEDHAPRSITRSSDTTWTLATISLTNVPQFDFNDGSSPSPTSEIQTLNFANQNEGDRYKLSLEGLLTDEITFAGEDDTNEENIRVALQELITTGKTGISVSTDVALDTYRITLAGGAANDWDLITATPVFTKSASFEVATVRVQAGSSRAEDVWSATRGWPRTCTFHESRLYFGGSTSRPSTIWGSNVGDFYNFNRGRVRDDEGIDVTIDTDQVNAIEAVFSNRSLQIFTSGGEFYVPQSPIKPTDISVVPQSKQGSKRVRPVTIDGVTLFCQRTGKAIIQFVFINEFQANQSRSVSILAPHLIKDPVEMAVSRGTESTDANYVYIVNADGSLTVFNTLAIEDVSGFTSWDTTGLVKSAAVVGNEVYLLVEREIDSSTVYQIERENSDYYTDATVADTTDDDEITGLDHLEGETVWAKADGSFMGEFVVSGGLITLPRTSTDKEAGLSYTPTIKTMPLNVPLQNGPNAASKKKILRVAPRLHESNGVLVNGQRIPDRTIGQDQFDAPTPQTGIPRRFLSGWGLTAQVTITQDTPMPLTILSIGMEAKT